MITAYVYVVFDRDGVPRYVGKGRRKRWRAHAAGRSHNQAVARLVADADGELPTVVVRDGLTDDQAFDVEVALIAAIGRGDRGPLLNLSDGGDGIGAHTQESRAKLSAARKGKPLSAAVRESIRLGHLGKRYSPEHRAAIGAGQRNRTYTSEQRAAMSAQRRGKPSGPITEKRRASIRAAVLAYWDRRRQQGLPLMHPRPAR